jgi:hypothetical protein
MTWVYQKLLIAVINWLTGIGSDGFNKVTEWVQKAEMVFTSGADKAAWVKEQIVNVLKITTPFILNLLTEVAVAYAKKQGWIK